MENVEFELKFLNFFNRALAQGIWIFVNMEVFVHQIVYWEHMNASTAYLHILANIAMNQVICNVQFLDSTCLKPFSQN